MDEKDWQLLEVLYKEKSVTKAALNLYLSQPAVTYRLAKMEKELDTSLFIRSSKGICFTSAGERLLTFTEKMLRQYSDIKECVNAVEGIVSGTLRLGSSAVFAHNELPWLLKEFHQKYPAVEISLHAGLSNDILQLMYKESICVAIIRGTHPWNQRETLLQEESLCIISAEPLTLADLPHTPGIYYHTDPTMQYQIDRWWQENFSVPPNLIMHVDGVLTCRQLVLAGLGWAIVPASRLPDSTSGLYITEIRNKENQLYKRPTRLIYTHTAKEIDTVRVFIDFMYEKKYKSAYLWTTNEQLAAASLYRKFGFTLTEEKESITFGKSLIEQRYDFSFSH